MCSIEHPRSVGGDDGVEQILWEAEVVEVDTEIARQLLADEVGVLGEVKDALYRAPDGRCLEAASRHSWHMAQFRVQQIDHVELFVPDPYAAADWYERVLGARSPGPSNIGPAMVR